MTYMLVYQQMELSYNTTRSTHSFEGGGLRTPTFTGFFILFSGNGFLDTLKLAICGNQPGFFIDTFVQCLFIEHAA